MAHPQERISNDELRITSPHIGRPNKSTLAGGGMVTGDINNRKKTPIKMKQMLMDRGISNMKMAGEICHPNGTPISGSAVNLTLNHGYLAGTIPRYKEQLEDALRTFGFSTKDINTAWQLEPESNVIQLGSRKNHIIQQRDITEITQETEMLSPTAKKLFNFERDPFVADIRKDSDVYMGEQHKYLFAAMMDAAIHGGFFAAVGECGSGKSVISKLLINRLNEIGDVRVITPRTIDKRKLTSNLILDAIIRDLAPGATVKPGNEAKARQVLQLLLESSRNGRRHVLIIEEAHRLEKNCLKQLKCLWELEDGYHKILGIILIAQPEMLELLDIGAHPELREVSLRVHLSKLLPLSRSDVESYIALKLERAGSSSEQVMCGSECTDALCKALLSRNKYSIAYPLNINNILTKAMNAAAQAGESLLTPEIISAQRRGV